MAATVTGPEEVPGFRSGFVTVLGRPNVGKSTLLNALLGRKIAIVSDKPQTTRTRIQGVLHLPQAQVIFVDTPGIHRPGSLIGKRMVRDLEAALDEPDLVLFLGDASVAFGKGDEDALEVLRKVQAPAILLLNKVDLLKRKSELLPMIEQYRQKAGFEEFIPISALRNDGLERVLDAVLARLPNGPCYFPEGHITDQPERFFASEIIREKVLEATRQEVPHAVLVEIEGWEETPRLLRISASIWVEREGQKAIVIGAAGTMLKRIGTKAREELEEHFARKVFVELFVKVRPNWRENPLHVSAIDWRA